MSTQISDLAEPDVNLNANPNGMDRMSHSANQAESLWRPTGYKETMDGGRGATEIFETVCYTKALSKGQEMQSHVRRKKIIERWRLVEI